MTTTKAAAKRGKKYILAAAGGGGKSTLAMLFSSTAMHHGIQVDLFDIDPVNPTLRRYFKTPEAGNARVTGQEPARLSPSKTKGGRQ